MGLTHGSTLTKGDAGCRCGLGALVGENAGASEDLSLDLIGLEVELEVPVLYLLGLGDHLVELGDAADAVVRLLEEALSDVGHDLLVLADPWRDANQDAELGREINVLLFLLNFKKRLVGIRDLGLVDLQEVVEHSDLFVACLTLVEHVGARGHLPTYSVDLVGSLLTVVGHDDRAVKIAVYVVLIAGPL